MNITPRFGALILDREKAKADLGQARMARFEKTLAMIAAPVQFSSDLEQGIRTPQASFVDKLEKNLGVDVAITTSQDEVCLQLIKNSQPVEGARHILPANVFEPEFAVDDRAFILSLWHSLKALPEASTLEIRKQLPDSFFPVQQN